MGVLKEENVGVIASIAVFAECDEQKCYALYMAMALRIQLTA